MSAAIPYQIEIRDSETLGAPEGEHEVCFTSVGRPTQAIVIRLTDAELLQLAAVANGRLVTQTIIKNAAGKGGWSG
jgi:hypothetical protein